jgi:hypothetical protein
VRAAACFLAGLLGVTAADVSEASEFAAVLETVIERDRFGGATAIYGSGVAAVSETAIERDRFGGATAISGSGVAAVSETPIERDRFAGAGNGNSGRAIGGAGCATVVSGIAIFAAA